MGVSLFLGAVLALLQVAPAQRPTPVLKDADEFQSDFNAAKDAVRVVIILSPS